MSTIEKALKAKQKALQAAAERIDSQETHDAIPSVSEPDNMALEKIVIDESILNEKGMVSSSREARKIRDEYRNIKLKLLTNAFGAGAESHKNGNLIMVSSANPGEGKTFTSINLALSIALEKDKTVLLVDADVLKPSVMKTLKIANRPGLMEYLEGEIESVSEVIYPTSIENLRIMPAGMPHDLSNELLTSSKMATLAKELAQRYPDRVVVFDCPPLLGINETKVLSNLVGQALVVVDQDSTKLAEINEAVSQLDRDLAIGFVLNKVVRGAFSQQGYGYGYGYGYGSDDDKTSSS